MSLRLVLLTNDPVFASEAESAGVDRICVDLEILNKRERQRERNTVISNHQIDDIRRLRAVLTRSQLVVRTNPIHHYLHDEIESSLRSGADALMLPMVVDADDVRAYVDLIRGRARVIIMVETTQAMARLDEIVDVGGVDEIFIGLNDLHIGLGLTFMFEVLSAGLLDHMAGILRPRGMPFGFGGMAKIGEGQLPAERILAEHYRLGSQSVILSRTFKNDPAVNAANAPICLSSEICRIREKERELAGWSQEDFECNRKAVQVSIRTIVASMTPSRLVTNTAQRGCREVNGTMRGVKP